MIGARHQGAQILAFLDLLSQPLIKNQQIWQEAGLAGLLKGLKKSEASDEIKETLTKIESTEGKEVKEVVQDIRKLYSSSLQ